MLHKSTMLAKLRVRYQMGPLRGLPSPAAVVLWGIEFWLNEHSGSPGLRSVWAFDNMLVVKIEVSVLSKLGSARR